MARVTDREYEAGAKAAYARSFRQVSPSMLPPGWRGRFDNFHGPEAIDAAWAEIADQGTRHYFRDLVRPVLDAAAAVRD